MASEPEEPRSKNNRLEDCNFDYKEKIDESFGKILCAYANTGGGSIVLGISKHGKATGVSQKDEESATNIAENCKPSVKFTSKWEEKDGKNVLTIDVPKSDRIHTWKGIAYKRVGSSSFPMGVEEIIELSKKRGDIKFDEEICERATTDEIDVSAVRWFLRKAKTERNYDIDPEMPIIEALEKLNLIRNGKTLNSAILLFSKMPERFIPQSKIRAARFKGTEGLDYIDMKVFAGTIMGLKDNAMKFIMQHIKHGVFFDDNRRYDKWEYPLRALEEGINNSLAHRDYFSASEIHLSIYDDRIEIWNPGELPSPLTPDDLRKKHKSIPRNKLLADTLFLIKFIEEWGRGTNRIINEIRENKLPDPIFQNLSGGFEIVFNGPGKTFDDEIEKEKLHTLDINERQKKAIEYAKEKGKITRSEYLKINNVSHKTAHLELRDLVEKNIFAREGRGSATRYVLKR